MPLTRRQFLTVMGGSAAGAVMFQACGVPEEEYLVQSPIEMPEDMVTGLDNWYATLCRQCVTSEGIVVRVIEGRAKKVEGNPDYPINGGKHSARCEAGLQSLYHPDRIGGPLVRLGERGEGRWEEISWVDAIGRLALRLDEVRKARNQAGVVMVTDPVGAHQGMVVERFVSKFGGKHLPYEPLERAVLRAAMRQVYGQDMMPDFDIANAGYLLSFGSDFLNTWVSPVRYARAYGRFRQGDRERGTLVHVESRFSMTAANADEWMYVRPGMEGLLALSIAAAIIDEGLGDAAAADALTGGGDQRDRFVAKYAPEQVAERVGVSSAERIRHVATEFATHQPSLAIGGGSAGAHTNGLDNLAAIYSLNYLVGSVGQRGGVLFNPTPPLDDIPASPAVASFADMHRLSADMHDGKVSVLMVRGSDPMYGLPTSIGFRDASYNVPLIVSFSNQIDDTTAMADLVLPDHNYLEDWGSDVPDPGPGHQLIGFQQPVVRPFFEPRGVHLGTKSFPDVLMATAQALDIDLGLPGDRFEDVLQEGARKLFESGRGVVGVTRVTAFSDVKSFWNAALRHGFWRDEAAKSADSVPTPPRLPEFVEAKHVGPTGPDTFHLIPFASASLTDGRGADLPWLQATPDPMTTATWQTWVEINSKVADEKGIGEGEVIRVISDHGEIEALAYPYPGASPDAVSIPIGQGHVAGGRYAEGRGANVLSILTPSTDEGTGALAWASTRVRIEKAGRWKRLPKFKNTAPDLAVDEEHHIIQITPNDT